MQKRYLVQATTAGWTSEVRQARVQIYDQKEGCTLASTFKESLLRIETLNLRVDRRGLTLGIHACAEQFPLLTAV